MRMSYNEKIEKINNDRILMFSMLKERISKDNFNLRDSLDISTLVLNIEEKNSKEYKAVIKAKQLIFDLTEEITKADSVEKVVALRKKINYYINKIKKELVKRNVKQEIFEQMNDEIDYLRNNMSMYIRFLKRENLIAEIVSLCNNTDNLSPEDRNRLKKLLKNELNYNKRILKNMNSNQGKNFDDINSIASGLTNVFVDIETNVDSSFKEDICLALNEDLELATIIPKEPTTIVDCQYFYNETYLSERVAQYDNRYNFAQLFSYNGGLFKNLISFFRNIPRYRRNKQVIKMAERDYQTYYHGFDLGGFIGYSKKRNSIMTAIDIIFKNSSLSKREIECLENHRKCMDWILEFYDFTDFKDEYRGLVRVR